MKSVLLAILACIEFGALADLRFSGNVSVSGKHILSGSSPYVKPVTTSFTISTNGGLPTLSVTFTDTSTETPTSWDWDWGDGTAHGTTQNPTHNFTTLGNYTVRLSAANAGGGTAASTNIAVWFAADNLIDFETGTSGDLMTTTIMTNSTHGPMGAWTIQPAAQSLAKITNVQSSLLVPVVVDGVVYNDAGSTRSAVFRLDNLTNYVKCAFPGSYSNVSVTTFIKTDTLGGSSQTVDYLTMEDSLGHFAVMQQKTDSTIHTHSGYGGTTHIGWPVSISGGAWVTYQFASGNPGTVTLYVYNTNGAFVGRSMTPCDATTMQSLKIGRIDSHPGGNPPSTSWVRYDNITINTNGTFPLGFTNPPAATVITFRPIGSNATTTGSSTYSTSQANTISANALALTFVGSSLASGADPTSVTGCGLTWTKVASTNYNSAGQRISVWRAMTNATTPSQTITATFGASQTGCNIRTVEFSGVDTSGVNGSGAIVRTAMATNATANPSITMATLTDFRDAAIAFFGNVSNGFSGTPEAGWIEDWDSGYNSPATGAYIEYQLLATDFTPSVTASAQQWAGIAIELKVAGP